MKEIILSNGGVALVDDEDYAKLCKYKWRSIKGKITKYAARAIRVSESDKKGMVLMHMTILGYKEGYEIDHINGDGLDNRKKNLRHVTVRQNAQNRRVKTSSKYPGVTWHKRDGKWQAAIVIRGRTKFLGYYNNEVDAFSAYKKAVEEMANDTVINII
jgi:hypothetical protein